METQYQAVKEDRRAIRSKRLIIEAWRSLALEKDPKEISVSDIVKRADIGRATFYAHFEDKNQLSKFLFDQLLIQIEQQIQTILDKINGPEKQFQQLVPSLAIFRIAQEKHRWFKLNATNPESGLIMLVPPLIKRLENRLEELGLHDRRQEIPIHMATKYLVNALIAILIDWVLTDMPLPPEKMDEVYQSLAMPTFERLLGSS